MGKLTNLLRGQPTSHPAEMVSQAEARLEAGRAAMIAAEAALDAARAAYDASLSSGRDAALAARRARDEAEVDLDVSRAAMTVFVAELDATRQRAKEDETARLVAEATEKARQFEALVRRELPQLAESARNLARLWAEAEIARDEANRMIESKTERLPLLEAFRVPKHRPGEVIEESIVELWVAPGTCRPLNDKEIERVRESAGKYFLYWKGKSGFMEHPEELGPKVRFKRTVSLPSEEIKEVKSLLTSLNIPGLTSTDPDGWLALEHLTPHEVLRQLSELEKVVPIDTADHRVPEVRLVRCKTE